jgi:hypothetical protein
MSHLPYFCPLGLSQYFIQRSNNRTSFASDEGLVSYAHLLHRY